MFSCLKEMGTKCDSGLEKNTVLITFSETEISTCFAVLGLSTTTLTVYRSNQKNYILRLAHEFLTEEKGRQL